MKHTHLYFILIGVFLMACRHEPKPIEIVEVPKEVLPDGKYISKDLPTNEAKVFMPNFISKHLAERDAALSPTMDAFYYTIWLPTRRGVIMVSKKVNNVWQKPTPAPFSGVYNDLEPTFSPDGSKLYFVSNRPLNNSETTGDFNVWYVFKTNKGWTKPYSAGKGINSPENEFYPSVAKNGTIYFTRQNEKGEKIFYSPVIDGKHNLSYAMSDSINFSRLHYNAFVDPDEKYLIYSAYPSENSFGGGDLLISFREKKRWKRPVNMGSVVNTPYLDYCPSVSPDGKFFFFTSGRVADEMYQMPIKNYEDVLRLYNANENGNSDIYWISTTLIQSLNPEYKDGERQEYVSMTLSDVLERVTGFCIDNQEVDK